MKRRLVELARQAFRRLGYEVRTQRLAVLETAFHRALVDWTRTNFSLAQDAPRSALGVIFSKDRALQLHALLESWFAQVEGEARLVVLWTASNAAHESSYGQLQERWGAQVEWVREAHFREDLLRVLHADASSHVFFITDDAVVLRPFALAPLLRFNPLREIVALTHGPRLQWCFIAQRPQRVPELAPISEGLLQWEWRDGDPGTEWIFPLSVDGKFFHRHEMSLLLSHLPFWSPNSLETGMQAFQPLFVGRKGICLDTEALVNIPCNAVQTEYDNAITGLYSTGDLLERWQAGQRIDWNGFVGKAPAEAEAMPYTFVPRGKL